VSDDDYTRRYFSDGAGRWRANAYGAGSALPRSYPVGARRVGVALDLVTQRLPSERGRLLDIGCGGGDLCIEAARLGFETTGLDIAEGMIAEAERSRQGLPETLRRRMTFVVGDALDFGGPRGAVDAVTALGLLEYLEADEPFFRKVATWLRPGGVLVVSCRNRLFNLASLNDYTARELQTGAAAALLDELGTLRAGAEWREGLISFVARLREALPELEQALEDDADDHDPPPPTFAAPRRQHTPRELAATAAAAGLRDARVIGVHPHVFPPACERLAPRTYNRLAACFEAFERSPASLAWCSAFVAVFSR
jgi:SAM-dependent methyltransferase